MARGSRDKDAAVPALWYAIYGQGYVTRRRMLHHIKAHDRAEPGLFDAVGGGDWYGNLTATEHRACAILLLAGLVSYDTAAPTPTLHLTESGSVVEAQLSTHTPHIGALSREVQRVGARRPQSAGATSPQ